MFRTSRRVVVMSLSGLDAKLQGEILTLAELEATTSLWLTWLITLNNT